MTRPPLFIFPERGKLPENVSALVGTRAAEATALCHEEDREQVCARSGQLMTYSGGNLAPCRDDLETLRPLIEGREVHVVIGEPSVPPYLLTTLRLLGATAVTHIGGHSDPIAIPPLPDLDGVTSVLIKMSGGIGNVVLNSCLVTAALRAGWRVWFCPVNDLNGESLKSLFDGHGKERLEVIAPEDLDALTPDLTLNIEDHLHRKDEDFFHGPYRVGVPGHEPGFAARFFKNVTGIEADLSETFVGGNVTDVEARLTNRVVVCPGSKTGWDSKRWPHMNDLLTRLDNPIVLCRQADLAAYAELDFLAPITADNAEYLTDLSLTEAAALLKSARAVIANDCGPAHMAAAAGVPTLFLFGPSSLEKNAHKRDNVTSLSLGLDCQPCQGACSGPGRLAPNDYACAHDFRCLADLSVERVLTALHDPNPAA